jgi:uncharacterized protein (DUF924 family)
MTTRSADLDPHASQVLDYWFGPADGPEAGTMRKIWFAGGQAVDDAVRKQFAALHERAVAGELDAWKHDALGCLALVIVLDQFSRNLHRGTARAFAADPKALALATWAVEQGFDRVVGPMQRWFFYLPFEHAEDLAHQQRCIALFEQLPPEGQREMAVDYARKHLEIIERFGRFPHRNEMLGRPSTAEEAQWLADGGTRFG